MDDYRLYDAELRLMELVWQLEPVNSTQLTRLCLEEYGWKKPTTFNLIRKLAGRGFLRNENATVTALVKRAQVRQYERRGGGAEFRRLPARLCRRLFAGAGPLPG